MANNPNVNKVVYGNQTVMDITDTTAEPEDVLEGEVFYDRSGTRQRGSAVIPDISNCYQTTDTAETDLQDADYIPFYDTSATAKKKSLWSNIKAKLNEVFFRRSEANILGAKNLLPLTTIAISGDNIWTIMDDGTVVANGTPSANAQLSIRIPDGLSGNFLFSGCPDNGSGATFDVYPWDGTTNARPKKWDGTTACASDNGGTSQEIQIPSGHRVSINCRVYGNFTANNLVFKPMLRLATDTDDTFEPFAMTNKELTDRTIDIENQLAVTVTEENLRDTVGWTCKNLIALPPVGTVQETNGITFTVRSDGGVSVVGTSTANTLFYLATDKLYAGEYTASCIFDGTPDGQYPIFSQALYAQDGTLKQIDYMTISNTSSAEKTKSIEGTDYLGNIVIYVASGKTVDQILYPMIRKASIKDSTFEPYHGTVDEVKADKSSLATVATSGDYGDLENTPTLADVATSGSYNDLEETPTIPDKLSDLEDDETHRLVTDTEIDAWNDKADNSVIAPVENGTTASQAYAIGKHFIKDGAFCTAIAAIASGATLTLNTNYIEGQIDAESILNGKILTSSDNLDNITDFGIYSWGGTYPTTPTNSPVIGSAAMFVVRYSTAGIHQIVFSERQICIRVYASGSWSAWRKSVIYDDVTYGTLTLQSGVTGTLGNAVCYKKNGMVTLGGRITGSSATADKAILSVPSGYRPSYRTWGFGAVYDTVRSAWVMGSVSVETNGNIAYFISSNACSQFLFQFTYPASS